MLSTAQKTRCQLRKCTRELFPRRAFSCSRPWRIVRPQFNVYDVLYQDDEKYLAAKKVLKPETALVLLEDILERHQYKLTDVSMPHHYVGRLCAMCMDYASALEQTHQPIAAINFVRNWITGLRKRVDANEIHSEARLVSALWMLYHLLRIHGGHIKERWRVIHETKTRVERLTPNDWIETLPYSLRDANAEILQFYTKEKEMALADPRTRKLGLGSLIAAHEKVVQLEKGGSKADLLHTRIESLRILCQLKQEQGPDVDFRVYAQEFHEATGHQFTKALSEPPASDSKPTLHASVLHERSMGFILLCRAQMRAKKYEMAIKTANQGLEITNMITKTLGYGMPIEICQLGIMISECYLRTEKYPEALEHARLALSLAERVPEDKNPILDALGVESDNLIWINRAGLNFCDTVYDSKVNAPGEEFGLKAAREGEKRNKAKLNIQFELEFAERALKAVHKAGRHAEALEASRSLLERLVKHLPESGSRYLLVLDQIDDVCEYAAESLEKIKMHTLANELRDKADDFNEFVQLQEEKEDQPLSVFADRAEDLRDAFFAIYKQAQESQSGLLPSPGQDSSKSDASSGPSSMAKLWKDWKNS